MSHSLPQCCYFSHDTKKIVIKSDSLIEFTSQSRPAPLLSGEDVFVPVLVVVLLIVVVLPLSDKTPIRSVSVAHL